MKNAITFLFTCITLLCTAQTSVSKQITENNPPEKALAPLRFLASDELQGRGSTAPIINVAAKYIAESFRSYGLKEFNGFPDYVQSFDIRLHTSPDQGRFSIGGHEFRMGESLLSHSGNDLKMKVPVVYAGYGTEKELEKIDVKGKVVITDFGVNENSGLMESVQALMEQKSALMAKKGALAIVERFQDKGLSWEMLRHASAAEVVEKDPEGFRVLLVNDPEGKLKKISRNAEGELVIQNTRKRNFKAKNILGYVEGTDPKLKKEYLLLSAHYDHTGVAPSAQMVQGRKDSIFNGARDNAAGVSAMMAAARYFAKHPPKRSVLFVAYAAEEIGLVGSTHFVSKPPVPLSSIIFNLNNDSGGYNDTSAITVFGSGRTSADNDIRQAAGTFGLRMLPEPSPEENLFMRSDNFPLARVGIPAITYTLGLTAFDAKAKEHYHQVTDEVGNMDLDYVLKYINTYIHAPKNIADNPATPVWSKGEPFEAKWKELYGK